MRGAKNRRNCYYLAPLKSYALKGLSITISSTASVQTFEGNGATLTFTFSFVWASASDIQVLYTNTSGVQTTLNPSQYTLVLNPPAVGQIWGVGGTVTYPTSGTPIANGTSLTVRRIVPLTQDTSISNQGDFYPQSVEAAMDTLCLEIQQVSGRTGLFRGTWAPALAYNYGDIVVDGVNGANTTNYYMCIIANTSSIWATDLANGDWELILNVSAIVGPTGTAGGDLTGSYPNPTIAKIQGTTVSGTTGSGKAVLSVAPTITGTLTTQDIATQTIEASGIGSFGANGGVDGQITLFGATSGSAVIAAQAVAGSSTTYLPTNNGTSGQFLQTDGTGLTSWQTIAGLTSMGAVITTSGTTVDFTGIPSTAKLIYIVLSNVGTNGSNILSLRVGSGSIITSGYLSAGSTGLSTNAPVVANGTIAINLNGDGAPAYRRHGVITLSYVNATTWVASGTMGHSDSARLSSFGGTTGTLSGALDRVQLWAGGDSFTAGVVNVLYQ